MIIQLAAIGLSPSNASLISDTCIGKPVTRLRGPILIFKLNILEPRSAAQVHFLPKYWGRDRGPCGPGSDALDYLKYFFTYLISTGQWIISGKYYWSNKSLFKTHKRLILILLVDMVNSTLHSFTKACWYVIIISCFLLS